MRVFVTGATGFVGTAVVRELLGAGHQVLGLARSDKSAGALAAAGAEVHRATLDDLDALRAAAAGSDGVIHTAFKHDLAFSGDFPGAAAADLRAIEALGEALAGSGRPFVMTSGTGAFSANGVATEESTASRTSPAAARIASEDAASALAERGVRMSVVRLPPSVHSDADKHGFIPILVGTARAKGAAAYVGDGTNRWAAVHQLDAAHLFRLALESAPAGSRLHGVGDEGVPVRDIAEAIGRQLNLPVISVSPEAAADHFGSFATFVGMDVPASSALTRQRFGWEPAHPGLIEDLEAGHYFKEG
jgi:nucleoside-diphosphate-sugar epimerase